MKIKEFRFTHGEHVKDVLTGFKGYISYRVDYNTGCDQYGIQPVVNKDGSIPEPKQFDENRLKLTGKPPILIGIERDEAEKKLEKPGGPAQTPQRHSVR